MNNDLATLLFPILCLGGWTWYISRKLDEAYENLIEMNDTISTLALECEALGSKKVKVTRHDPSEEH